MVIVEIQGNGTALLRGRGRKDRARVPYWPTASRELIQGGAEVGANPDWIKECAALGAEELAAR
jgi:hypothetical protein